MNGAAWAFLGAAGALLIVPGEHAVGTSLVLLLVAACAATITAGDSK